MKFILVPVLVALYAFQFISCNSPGHKAGSTDTLKDNTHGALRAQVDSVARIIPSKAGLAAINIETGDTFSYHGQEHYPMFSTYKFPLALYILHLVEEGKLSLGQKVRISKKEMEAYNTGRFIESHAMQDIDVTVDSLIYYAISYSDNITTDHLFTLAGGPAVVDTYIHNKGISNIAIVNTVGEMFKGDKLYYNNWVAPYDMARLLQLFYTGKLLNPENTAYLRGQMEQTPTGAKRIKGLLPGGTVVAHKTGTGAITDGVTAGTNDIGIITLPNGQHLVLAVYVCDVTATVQGAEAIIANLANVVYKDAVKTKAD